MTKSIDTHHHFIPPRFREIWNANNEKARGLVLPYWSIENTLGLVKELDLAAAVLSLGHPIHLYVQNQNEVGSVCREINEYAAKLRDEHPENIGFLATLPPLDRAQDCIEEIRFALGTLKADGVIVFTSYNQCYLGHPDFRAVWAELDRLKAVALIHPGFEGMEPIREPFVVTSPLIDWTHETTRAAIHLITNGVTKQFPNVKMILSHAGGTLPYVIQRAAKLSCRTLSVEIKEEEFVKQAQSFYIDVAMSGYNPQLRMLKDFAKPGHVLFGTDYPFASIQGLEKQVNCTSEVFGQETLRAALEVFPRLSKYHDEDQ